MSEIERAVGVLDSFSVRKMLIETQDYILYAQKESLQATTVKDPRLAVSR
ncbi:MAG TPA: hypothetical protein VGR47_04840 [Terracidiphilus sp.]|nr:hypothetical protein [Terracidiphilus sp.]